MGSHMTSITPERCQLCAMLTADAHLCATLTKPELENLNAASQINSLRRDETIPESSLDRWPIIAVAKGELSIQYVMHDGRRTIAAFLSPGDILDTRQLENKRLGSLVALNRVEFCRLDPTVFDEIVADNADARSLVWSNVHLQAQRSVSHAADLAKKKAPEKLASFILECSSRFTNVLNNNLVRIPMRRRDLAGYLGMQPETVSRCFKDLEEKGIIKVTGAAAIRIIDRPSLRLIANGAGEEGDAPAIRVLRLGA